jgi:HlyD family type I secretion membrane fusion protein
MPPVPSLFRRAPKDLLAAPISAFESETQAVFVRTAPYSEHAILHVLTGLIILVIVLMAVVKIDMVVAGTGQIMPTRGQLFVQPLDRSIVRSLNVHTGDIVKAGQALAELDPTFAKADVDQYTQHLALDTALVSRLEAELAGRPYVAGPTKPEQLQFSIWQTRQKQFSATVANFDEMIKSTEALIVKEKQDIAYYSQHSSIATKVEGMETTLANSGNGSTLKKLNAQDTRVEQDRLLEETKNALAGSLHDLESLHAQRLTAIDAWNADIGMQLSTARDDMSQTMQSLNKATKTAEMIVLTAPEDAIVLNIGSVSNGTVIDPATQTTPLFTLVPLSGPIEAEVDIQSSDIGFPRVGDPVHVKLDAYPFIRYGLLDGTVTNIGGGAFTLDINQQPTTPYFKARVRIDKSELHDVPKDFRVIPGMTLSGDVLVGKRTILSYLVEGALRTSSEAMREP